jgi:hypothetical protein
MQAPESPPIPFVRKLALSLLVITFAIVPINTAVFFWGFQNRSDTALGVFVVLALTQCVFGLGAILAGVAWAIHLGRAGASKTHGVLAALGGLLGLVGGVVGGGAGFFAFAFANAMGGAWGRPLRVRGRVIHPELDEGTDWTLGDLPDAAGLDPDTRAALAALWLHDAQKEHASVPAFARVTWMLTAAGAPAELVDRSLVAAREEVDHTRRCFALAAGYGGRSYSVEPMPDLLLGGALDLTGNVFVHLAVESLKDGCLLEDYNADVAAECALACSAPVTRAVLQRIAVEERAHAELSWSILSWCLERGGLPVRERIARERNSLARIARPTAVSADKQALVARADPALLRAHGRLPDARWAEVWEVRRDATQERLDALLGAAALGGSTLRAGARSNPRSVSSPFALGS